MFRGFGYLECDFRFGLCLVSLELRVCVCVCLCVFVRLFVQVDVIQDAGPALIGEHKSYPRASSRTAQGSDTQLQGSGERDGRRYSQIRYRIGSVHED